MAAAVLVDDTQEGFKKLVENIKAVTEAIGRSVKDFVALANPAAAFYFNLALRDLGAVIGQALLPAIRQLTSIIRAAADIFASLPAPVKSLISAIVLTTIIFVGLRAITIATTAVFAALRAAAILSVVSIYGMTTATAIFGATATAVTAGLATVAAPFLLVGAAIIGVISLFVDLGEAIKGFLDAIGFGPDQSSFGTAVQPVTTSSIQGVGVEQAKRSLEVGNPILEETKKTRGIIQRILDVIDGLARGILLLPPRSEPTKTVAEDR